MAGFAEWIYTYAISLIHLRYSLSSGLKLNAHGLLFNGAAVVLKSRFYWDATEWQGGNI